MCFSRRQIFFLHFPFVNKPFSISQPKKLTANMCQILNIPYDYCMAAITELQTSALDKLKARDEFVQTGLKLKLVSSLCPEISDN